MRLKKSKELETKKSQQFDGITRLVCTSKSQNNLLSGEFMFVLLALLVKLQVPLTGHPLDETAL